MLVLGAILLVLAFLLAVGEAHLSSGGLIGAGAAIALVGGLGLLLAGTGAGLLGVVAVSAVAGVASAGAVVLLARSAEAARRLRPRSGNAALVGHVGVMRISDSSESVFVDGGLWRARPSLLEEQNVLHDGDSVVVEHVNGLTLYVRKAEELELQPWS